MTTTNEGCGLPAARRARDYHVYDYSGRRYLDMWLNGGRALLGHRPGGLGTVLKNQLAKGVLAEAPSVYDGRLRKALKGLVPGSWTVRVYRSFDRALRAAGLFLGRQLDENDIREPFPSPGSASRDAASGGAAGYFRPLSGTDAAGFPVIFPVLPFPGAFAPQPVLFASPGDTDAGIPPDDLVSPFLAAGLLRVTERLQKAENSPDIWKDWPLSGWKRHGRYCFPEDASRDYGETRLRFLAAGVIISPDPARPTILPGVFSPGEKALVERLCRQKP